MRTFSPFGYEGVDVEVEVDLRSGIPATDIVGLSDGCVKEVRERVRSAFRNQGLEYPSERVLISLSPCDCKKEGAGYDLPIALAILCAKEGIEQNVFCMGELELNGTTRYTRGIEAGLQNAWKAGIKYAIVPSYSSAPPGMTVITVQNLKEAFEAVKDLSHYKPGEPEKKVTFSEESTLDEIEGHERLKFAMAVAVAGRHHMLVYGAPGCGKTVLLQKMPELMPELSPEEKVTVERIYSLAGYPSIMGRPFRTPHQTASIEGICGGGINCSPGEITLAHNGVLFLDEAAEFRTSVLQMLRVPMEAHSITLSRAGRTTVYPADFQLVMATNPCPCGNHGVKDRICLCSAKSVEQYWRKFSAPLLDRCALVIDAHKEGEYPHKESELREMIKRAWGKEHKELNEEAQKLIPTDYTPRKRANTLKIAQTIADMFDSEITADIVKMAIELGGNNESLW